MKRIVTLAFCVGYVLVLSACALRDSGTVWQGGPYALYWIDVPDDVQLGYRVAGTDGIITRVDARVFAVGMNEGYLVAMQHPAGNKAITNYFIIDVKRDSPKQENATVVMGPLTEQEYLAKSAQLSLPKFSKVLESLK